VGVGGSGLQVDSLSKLVSGHWSLYAKSAFIITLAMA